jgi:hypothetical protein
VYFNDLLISFIRDFLAQFLENPFGGIDEKKTVSIASCNRAKGRDSHGDLTAIIEINSYTTVNRNP